MPMANVGPTSVAQFGTWKSTTWVPRNDEKKTPCLNTALLKVPPNLAPRALHKKKSRTESTLVTACYALAAYNTSIYMFNNRSRWTARNLRRLRQRRQLVRMTFHEGPPPHDLWYLKLSYRDTRKKIQFRVTSQSFSKNQFSTANRSEKGDWVTLLLPGELPSPVHPMTSMVITEGAVPLSLQ